MPDIFDEVNEDLRAERAQAAFRRYGWAGAAALVLILAGTAGYVWWREQQNAAAEAAASRFLAAQKLAAPRALGQLPPKEADAEFAAIAASGPPGYRVLARLQLAALEWQRGETAKAVADWQAVSADASAPSLLRDFATLARAQHQLDSADPASLKAEILPIASGGSRWRPMAEQTMAMLDIRLGKQEDARAILKALSADPLASQNMREMAADALLALGDEGSGHKG